MKKNILPHLTALTLSMSAFSASSEVLLLAETGFIIENKIQVKADRETAWQVFTRDVGLWWPSDHTWWGDAKGLSIDTFAGGCFCEKSAGKSAEHMRISFVDPTHLMRMTGGLGPLQGMGMYGALEWDFKSQGEVTEVTMTYKVNGINPGGFEKLAPVVDKVQALQLGGLKQRLQNL